MEASRAAETMALATVAAAVRQHTPEIANGK